jgi:hypothetical protein
VDAETGCILPFWREGVKSLKSMDFYTYIEIMDARDPRPGLFCYCLPIFEFPLNAVGEKRKRFAAEKELHGRNGSVRLRA